MAETMADESGPSGESQNSGICPICENKRFPKSKLIKNPQHYHVTHLISCVSEKVLLGDKDLLLLEAKLKSYKDVMTIHYHSQCRKDIVNSTNLSHQRKRSVPVSSEENILSPSKRGRPPKQSSTTPRSKREPSKNAPKAKICVFHNCNFCRSESLLDLHQVLSDSKGQTLVDIKNKTYDDEVRACLSELYDCGDASALEKWYHGFCFIDAQRSCEKNDKYKTDKLYRYMCDCEIVVYVSESLLSDKSLTMNEINDSYIASLNDKGIETLPDSNHKKHLKKLLEQNVPGIEFIRPFNMRHSHRVCLKSVVADIVESSIGAETTSMFDNITKVLRQEVLDCRKWKFAGEFDTWKNPKVLMFVLKQILFGPFFNQLTGKRKEDAEKCIDVMCQIMCQNAKTDRQVKYKTEHVFKQTVQTPLSVGVPLTAHARLRDFNMVKNLQEVYIGEEYRHIINLEKRVEYAVIDRINKTGCYCIPDFVKKGVHLWFAIDNIDFLEATAYGQNTLHGTIIIVFQRDEDGEPVNPPLKIPITLPKDLKQLTINYEEEPMITLKPIRFSSFTHDFTSDADLKKYETFTETWAFASYAGNETTPNIIPERLRKVVPCDGKLQTVDVEDDSVYEEHTEEEQEPEQVLEEDQEVEDIREESIETDDLESNASEEQESR